MDRLSASRTPRTMPARPLQRVAKMPSQRGHLARILLHPFGHLPQPLDLPRLPLQDAGVKRLHQRRLVARPVPQVISLPHAGRLQLQPFLLGQIIQRPHHAVARLADVPAGLVQIDVEPRLGLLRLGQQLLQKRPSLSLEVAQDFRRRNQRLELVLGVKRRARLDVPQQFQVRQAACGRPYCGCRAGWKARRR